MTERIEKLYKQSTNQDYFPIGSEEVYMSAKDLKKFAELIVKECSDIASINQYQHDSVGNYVLKHFGVKE